MLLAAAAQTGLFADVGTSLRFGIPVAVYQFWHRVFQEFLAARAVLDGSCQDCVSGSDPVERITTITRDANWTPSFLDYDLNESWQEPVALCIALLEVPEAESALLAVAGESIENPRLALARTAFSIMNIDRGRDISETCVSVLVGRLAQLAAKISEIDVPVAFYFSCFHIAESRWCSILTEALAGSYTSATWVGRKAASTLLTGLSVPKEVREVIKGVLLRSTRSVGADTDGERQNQFIRLAFVDIQELSGRLFSNPPLPIGNPRLSLSDILDWIGSDPSTNELALWLVELLSKGGRGNDLVAHRDRSLPVFYQMVREHRLHSNGALHSVVEAFRIANDVRGVDLATEVLKQPEDFFRGDGLLRNTAKRAMEDLSSIISA